MAYILPSTGLLRSFILPLMRQCSGIGSAIPGTRSVPAPTTVTEVRVVFAYVNALFKSVHAITAFAGTAGVGGGGAFSPTNVPIPLHPAKKTTTIMERKS